MLTLLRKNAGFNALFWTQFTGALNDNVFKNALVILVTYQAANVFGLPAAQVVALAGGIFILPLFLFSAWAGLAAEKIPRVKIARFVKWMEVGIMMICSAGFFYHHFEFLLFGLFLMGLHSAIFGPVKYSLIPAFIQNEELNTGNAYVEAGTFVAILIGTILGGWSATQSTGMIITTLMTVSLIGLFFSYRMPFIPAANANVSVNWNFIAANGNILQVVKSIPGSMTKIIGLSWFWFLGAAVLSILPPYAKDVLLADENVTTLFLTVFTVGIAIGAGLSGHFVRKYTASRTIRIGGILMSLALIDWAFLNLGPIPSMRLFFSRANSLHLLLDLMLLAAGGGLFTVPQMTALQKMSPKHELSRVIAANNIVNSLFIVLAAVFLMMLYAMKFSFSQILVSIAILNSFMAIFIRR